MGSSAFRFKSTLEYKNKVTVNHNDIFIDLQIVALSEEVGMLKDERDKLSRSMKGIIHGAEDYKVLASSSYSIFVLYQLTCLEVMWFKKKKKDG